MDQITPGDQADTLRKFHADVCDLADLLHQSWRQTVDSGDTADNAYGHAADLLNQASAILFGAVMDTRSAEVAEARAAAGSG